MRGDAVVTIEERLSKEQKQRIEKWKKEKLSKRDIEELMGANRQTYTRKNGAVRNK